MASAQVSPNPANPTDHPVLNVDMQWRKLQLHSTDANNLDAGPLYITQLQRHRGKTHKRASDNQTIGSSKLYVRGIDAYYELHGRKDTIVAQKRFRPVYTQRSLAMSDTEMPVTLTWTIVTDFMAWNFVCVDEQKMPVARFVVNNWGVKRLGRTEFMGPRANSEALREEIVVVGPRRPIGCFFGAGVLAHWGFLCKSRT